MHGEQGEGAALRRFLKPHPGLLGVLAELQFQIIPAHDLSGGWSRHIWDNYGRTIAECAMEARRTDRAVKCSFDVHKP